jgi:hypothetical protein
VFADAFVGSGDECRGSIHGVNSAADGLAEPGTTHAWTV